MDIPSTSLLTKARSVPSCFPRAGGNRTAHTCRERPGSSQGTQHCMARRRSAAGFIHYGLVMCPSEWVRRQRHEVARSRRTSAVNVLHDCDFSAQCRLNLRSTSGGNPNPETTQAQQSIAITGPVFSARATGVEPATTGSTVRTANQLSYAPKPIRKNDLLTRIVNLSKMVGNCHFAGKLLRLITHKFITKVSAVASPPESCRCFH